ncbi:MAG: hypothetical protein ABL921_33245 [Pirellula sp.]
MKLANSGCRFFNSTWLAILVWTTGVTYCNMTLGQGQPDLRAQSAEKFRLELYQMASAVSAPEYVGRESEKDLEFLVQFPAIRKLCDEAEKEYATEIATQRQPFRNLAGTIGYSRERLAKFEEALKTYASLAAIREDANAILKSAQQSIEYQAPAYFKPDSDIDRRTNSMKRRLKVLATLMPDSQELKDGNELAVKTASEVRKIQLQLVDGILKQNELPSDNYTQADRKELIKLVEETWKKLSPGDKPILVGLIGSDWVRKEAWEIQNRTIYKIDRSRLQGFIVLPNDNKTVVLRHIQLQRDHTNQDKTTAWSISDPKSPIEPTELILRSKLK